MSRTAAVLVCLALVAPGVPARAGDVDRAPDNAAPWMTAPSTRHPTPWGLLDLDRTLAGQQRTWDHAVSLTGNWGGWRDRLADEYGLALAGAYTAQVAGNPVGGRNQGIRYTQNVGLAFLADLGKLAGWDETYFVASASDRVGESNSAKDIGNVFAVQQIYGFQTIRLVQLALGKRLFDGTLDLVAGRLNGLDDFIASPLYCNAQNLAFCGNPLTIPIDVNISSYPNAGWGFRARWEPHRAVYLMGGTYNTFAGFRENRFHGVNFDIPDDSGVIGIGEVGLMPFNLQSDVRPTDLPGHWKIGGYWDTEPAAIYRSGAVERGNGGFYLGFDQMVWAEDLASGQGLTPFVTFHWAPPDRNQFQHYVGWGVVWTGPIPGRDQDVAGVYGAWGQFSRDLRASQRAAGQPGQRYEMILEANYRIDVVPWFYFQPDIQGVISPGGIGDIPNALVLAMQFGVPF